MPKPIKSLLNEILGEKERKDIRDCIGKSLSYVAQILQGDQIPSDQTIALLAEKYAPERMGELLFAAAIARLERSKFPNHQDLKETALKALESTYAEDVRSSLGEKGRSFLNFPEAFEPLVIVTGDKREDRESWITIADLGARTATPADTRWIAGLGLSKNVVKHIDKNFLLLPENELIERFGRTNLLVVGSPAANHLARKINSSAIFCFNYSKKAQEAIEELIDQAKSLPTLTQLAAYKEQHQSDLEKRIRSLFAGGIFDPTYPDEYVAAKYAQRAQQVQLDWGVVTFAANPYYAALCKKEGRKNDHRYVSILAAGIHHPGTAHALRQLSVEQRERVFEKHPFGGVLRVELDLNEHFSTRVENAACRWEDEADRARKESDDQQQMLLNNLSDIKEQLEKKQLRHLELESNQVQAGLRLLQSLSEPWEENAE